MITQKELNDIDQIIRAPHGNGSGESCETFDLANAAATSSVETAIPFGTTLAGTARKWVMISIFAYADDCFVRFGTTGATGAATASDWPIAKGTMQPFLCLQQNEQAFRVYSATANASRYYLSGAEV